MFLALLFAQSTATTDVKPQSLQPRRFILPSGTKTACERGGPVGPWVSNADYPAEAQRGNMHGVVSFSLEVSDKGCPVSCTVDKSSGWELLDTRACVLMLVRARFKPAKDDSGNPATSKWSSRFNWSMN